MNVWLFALAPYIPSFSKRKSTAKTAKIKGKYQKFVEQYFVM
jgi:hypothetical protein